MQEWFKGNLLCAIDCETTGLDWQKHDIIQICILPANDDFKPSKQLNPLIMELKPRRPDNIDDEAMRINQKKLCDVMTRGLDYYKAADYFVEWIETLKLAPGKKLLPLACNWFFDREFIRDWLGTKTFELYFHHYHRDVMTAAIIRNDIEVFNGRNLVHRYVNLKSLCNDLEIQMERGHDAVFDAMSCLEVYRRLMCQTIA